MKILAIDGNSIINRAFYGIKLLTTKDGRFTNGIYGFLNILLKLKEDIGPDAVAVAFDLKAPTFRHKMYDGYKAGRKGMPDELAQQMPVLKKLLDAMGYTIIEAEGWEADDILGTISGLCRGEDKCFIATGDRDCLQLINENTFVCLASTKMGRAITTTYDIEKTKEDYGVSPEKLIDIKALMGDSSDNIPGVAGIGQKTATELIQRFDNIDKIYAELDTIDIKPSVRSKLEADKDMAYLSRDLGRISKSAPIDTDLTHYIPSEANAFEVTKILADLEMFKMIERLGIKNEPVKTDEAQGKAYTVTAYDEQDYDAFLNRLEADGEAYFTFDFSSGYIEEMRFAVDDKIAVVLCGSLAFPGFVKDFLENKNIKKYTLNTKQLYSYAIKNQINAVEIAFDAVLAGYILNPSSNNYELSRLIQEYGIIFPENEDEKISCTGALPALCKALSALIESNGQNGLLYDIEMPLARVLASMELVGFAVNEQGIEQFGEELDGRIGDLTAQIYGYAGEEFNINSPKQLGEILFEKLNLPGKKKTKSGYSTNAEVLEGLADEHPIIEKILEYRTLTKLKSTYCDGLLKVISPDGRIHSTLNQTETRTGRISSTEPNLQNIPVRSELGSQMRKFFIADKGNVLVDADYSQIELRVLAHIANDATMIEAFNNNDDIHTITASQVFNMPINMVTPLMRSRAKAVNFGIVYGIGAFSLAKDIGVTRAQADRYIKDYLLHYSGVDEYMHRVVEQAKEKGYVETLFARRRYLPELTASNAMLRAFGERVARNMPIQGTAADIIKIAMIRVWEQFEQNGLKARLIMQVHDELIVEAPNDEAETVKNILKEEMESAVKMKVNLTADVHCGPSWYDAKG
ncbi:MAG: DNA polymerase I [Clostridiales bacterium]|nr:DNA polymerase I [Clostridiales bacterium]